MQVQSAFIFCFNSNNTKDVWSLQDLKETNNEYVHSLYGVCNIVTFPFLGSLPLRIALSFTFYDSIIMIRIILHKFYYG